MQAAKELTQLEPFVVEGKSAQSFYSDPISLGPRTAGGNLDIARSADDALPYTVYGRSQILRSGVVDLNEFLQRELLDTNAAVLPPEQNGGTDSFIASSTNLNLRGYGSEETVILVNGRRLPEVVTQGANNGVQPPDVNFIPLRLVQQVEVLSASASALYTGNP